LAFFSRYFYQKNVVNRKIIYNVGHIEKVTIGFSQHSMGREQGGKKHEQKK
jgi:hypothetical protein